MSTTISVFTASTFGSIRRFFGWLSVLMVLGTTQAFAGQVNLTWTASSGPVAGYRVYYGTASGSYSSNLDVGNVTTATVPNFSSGPTYYFAVKAYDSASNESDFSNEVSVDTALTASFSVTATSGTAPLSVTFTDSSAGNIQSRLWTFGDGATSAEINPTHVYASGTYTARLTVTDALGNTATSNTATIAASDPSAPTSVLPSPWLNGDIGNVALAGSASYASSVFTLNGSGAGIGGSADAFHFAYRAMSGDRTIVARVANLTFTDAWATAGVMIRESLNANARHVTLAVTPSNGVAFTYRTTVGGTGYYLKGASNTAPYWVKLVRKGSTFTAYQSANGKTWKPVGSISISMGATIYVGLATTSHSNSAVLNTATFDRVSVN